MAEINDNLRIASKADLKALTAADVKALPDTTKQIDIGARPNANLLHNWYFGNPVNRNGKTVYSSLGVAIDRWVMGSDVLVWDIENKILTINYIYNSLIQRLYNIEYLRGQTMTLSVLANVQTAGQMIVRLAYLDENGTTIRNDSAWHGHRDDVDKYVMTVKGVVPDNASRIEVMFMSNVSGTGFTNFEAVKLELGDTQTLAHQENGNWVLNEIPDYAEQMAICMQYDKSSGAYLGATRHINPNLLHNWYFKNPVNQRGKTEYTESGYTIDRWYLNAGGGSNITVEDDGIHYQHGDGVATSFMQGLATADSPYILEGLKGKTVTLTTLYGDNLLATSTFTIPTFISANAEFGRCERPNNARAYHCMRWYTNGIFRAEVYETGNNAEDFTVVAMKLELGSEQTLAHQENGIWVLNEIPDYGEQLAICQRYQIEILCGRPYGTVGIGFGNTTQRAGIYIDLPVQARIAAPASPVQWSGNLVLTSDLIVQNDIPVTSIELINSNSTNRRAFLVAYGEGVEVGKSYILRANNDSTAKLLLDYNL